MARFDRYILSQLLALFGFFALVLVGVYWINRAVVLFDQIIGDGHSAMVFLEISALTLPAVIRIVLPVAAFVAAVWGTNRLMADSELVVLQATGFSPFRMARPFLAFGLSVAAMMLILTHLLVPLSAAEMADRRAEIAQNLTARILKEGQFLHPAKGITLFIGNLAEDGGIENLMLADHRNPARSEVHSAGRALFLRGEAGPRLIMLEGLSQAYDATGRRLSVTRFGEFVFDLGAVIEPAAPRGRRIGELPTPSLVLGGPEAAAAIQAAPAGYLEYEIHTRFGDPLLAVGAALLGLGALLQGGYSRFGLWPQIGLAVGLVVVVQVIATAAVRFGPGLPGGWVLGYAAPFAAAAMGAALLWRASLPRRHRPAGARATPGGAGR